MGSRLFVGWRVARIRNRSAAPCRTADRSNFERIGRGLAILLRSENLSQHPRRKERRGSLGRPHVGRLGTENVGRPSTETRSNHDQPRESRSQSRQRQEEHRAEVDRGQSTVGTQCPHPRLDRRAGRPDRGVSGEPGRVGRRPEVEGHRRADPGRAGVPRGLEPQAVRSLRGRHRRQARPRRGRDVRPGRGRAGRRDRPAADRHADRNRQPRRVARVDRRSGSHRR